MRIMPVHAAPQVRIHKRRVEAPNALNFQIVLENQIARDARR